MSWWKVRVVQAFFTAVFFTLLQYIFIHHLQSFISVESILNITIVNLYESYWNFDKGLISKHMPNKVYKKENESKMQKDMPTYSFCSKYNLLSITFSTQEKIKASFRKIDLHALFCNNENMLLLGHTMAVLH